MTSRMFIGYAGVAEILGIATATVRSYRRYGLLPDPDVVVDGNPPTPGWRPETIHAWNRDRPGPGNWDESRQRRVPPPRSRPAPPPLVKVTRNNQEEAAVVIPLGKKRARG